ncbi:DUF4344 domain-containing metallopeptidase [Sulfitobacter sp.]|uniref:DUF4344 domain-containing metallopeptidase n=1 Tax=Sulfitobacter sp. TaxID=1903071 RepID=UPI003F6B30C7|tara:strand:+ start:6781 stop:7494 length:714 start_codon:yes stop_codon:yes gene_type:complete
MRQLLFALAILLPIGACAEEAEDNFVSANLISIFYHEMGHALIDIMRLPVFGQEEDAADMASILFLDNTFSEQDALSIAYDTALGLHAESRNEPDPNDTAWGVHGASLQRFYNLVCLFYGADVDTRDDFAIDMGLPAERARTCAHEYQLADESWGPVFDELFDSGPGASMIYTGSDDGFAQDIIFTEVATLNELLTLPEDLEVTVEPCGQPNAFYDPSLVKIIICAEFEPYLRKLAR